MRRTRTILTLICVLSIILVLAVQSAATVSSEPGTSLPDLMIDALHVSPANPEPGQPICVRVTVRNQDEGPAGPFEIRAYVDPDGVPNSDTPPDSLTGAFGLPAGYIFRWDWCGYEFDDTDRVHQVWAWADPLGEVPESNDDNNMAHVNVGGSCAPDGYENDLCSEATPMQVNGDRLAANLCPRGDEDWYTFPIQAGHWYTVTAAGIGQDTGGLILRSWATCETGSLGPGTQTISFKAPPGIDTAWIQSKHIDVDHGLDTDYDIVVVSDSAPDKPIIRVSPSTVDVSLPKGQSTTVPLTIRNVGGEALNFSIAASVTSHRSSGISGHPSLVTDNRSPITDHWSPITDHSKIDPALWDALDEAPDRRVTFFVYLKEQADLSPAYAIGDWKARGEFVYRTLLKTAERTQKALLADLQEMQQSEIRNPKSEIRITDYHPFFILNAVAVTGGRSAVEALAARPDVAHLAPEPAFEIPEPIDEKEVPATPAGVEWNIAQIEADRAWADFGVSGEGVVVANIDTGVDYQHPALVRQYRGTATSSHDFNWFDPTDTYPDAPGDNHGHGTHTMGTMVGDDGAGNQIGVAPGAQWIAAKGCAGRGCSGSDLLAAGEWVLAPCPIGVEPGDDACDSAKRPQVVNNSWGGGSGDTWFEAMVSAWRASDIFPAFAAGNSGPGDGTVISPGDYASSFASGATDDADGICWFSSRGPSSLTPETKPDVTTPGCDIRSALPGGSYGVKSGTSMASPHTAGVVALLLDANPSLSVEQLEALLTSTAVDLGSQGPDNTYGYGRANAYDAVAKTGDPGAWLKVDPTSGSVNPGGQTRITLTLNAAGLAAGAYTANLVISSNDPEQPTVTVPVTLTVTAGSSAIAHVRVSNLRDVSASVSWITTGDADGRVYYGADPAVLTNVAHDDRGTGVEDDVHHVTIGGLNPDTTYYFYIVSGDAQDDNNGRYYQFKTGAPLPVPGSDSVYGQVFKSDGVTPAANVLVYLRVLDNDGQGSPNQSGLLSGLTDSNGYWIAPKTGGTVNLAAARTEDGKSYFAYSGSGDAVRIAIQGATDCEGLTQVDTAHDSPAADITLSCLNMIDLDITTGWSIFVWPAEPIEEYSAEDLLGAIAEAAGDAPENCRWLPEQGDWSCHLRGLPFGNFHVAPGEPYFLRANQRSLLRLPAGIGIVQNDVLALTTGWNFLALPRTAGVIMAEAACQQIVAQGGAVSEIDRWDANIGDWAGHICGYPFGDFEMTPDDGYFIKSQADSTWRPSGGTQGGSGELRGTRGNSGELRGTRGAVSTFRSSAKRIETFRIQHSAFSIQNVQVTNVTDRSFSVLWETDQPASGQVQFGSDAGALDGVAYDDRGTDVADRTHHVTVAGLAPETTYYFAVVSGGTTDDNGGQFYQVSTGPTLGIPTVQTAYGQVLRTDGETPAAGVLVRLVLRDADGEGSAGQSAPQSAVTDAQGYWSVNLGAARTPAGDAYFAATGADRLSVTAWYPALGDAGTEVTLHDLPAALPLEMTVARERVYLPLTRR